MAYVFFLKRNEVVTYPWILQGELIQQNIIKSNANSEHMIPKSRFDALNEKKCIKLHYLFKRFPVCANTLSFLNSFKTFPRIGK